MKHSPYAAAAVIALHALVLHALAPAIAAVTPQTDPEPAHEQRNEREPKLRGMTGGGLACASKYRGIGVRVNAIGVVIEVAPGGPADGAGILVGDTLVTQGYFFRPVGTPVELELTRDGRTYFTIALVADVCQEG